MSMGRSHFYIKNIHNEQAYINSQNSGVDPSSDYAELQIFSQEVKIIHKPKRKKNKW